MVSAVPGYEEWITPGEVGRLSSELGDPSEFAHTRADAFERFRELPVRSTFEK